MQNTPFELQQINELDKQLAALESDKRRLSHEREQRINDTTARSRIVAIDGELSVVGEQIVAMNRQRRALIDAPLYRDYDRKRWETEQSLLAMKEVAQQKHLLEHPPAPPPHPVEVYLRKHQRRAEEIRARSYGGQVAIPELDRQWVLQYNALKMQWEKGEIQAAEAQMQSQLTAQEQAEIKQRFEAEAAFKEEQRKRIMQEEATRARLEAEREARQSETWEMLKALLQGQTQEGQTS